MKPIFLATIVINLALTPISSWASAKDCAEYETGESRTFSERAVIGFFGAPETSYQVTRLQENQYLLEINPKFFEMKTRASRLNVPETYFEEIPKGRLQVQACFEWFNEKFSQSTNPQILLGVSSFPRQINIQITREPRFRSYVKKYNLKNMKACNFIVHESLHAMGLWDEYVEDERPNAKGLLSFNCRSISDSIMSNHYIYAGLTQVLNKDNTPKTPLRPAHLRQLLYPRCPSKNPVYTACVSNAYRSKETILNCQPAPAICQEKNLWLE